ncbi:hypothetical protein VTK73DRAFT_3402 [Phialemonium thermophilum]|uniref:Uncharacterized protein n=1 Tax=Phialemonium thermophilum TaxID=223376 RepID=A0ABR3WZL4_9PEZI
MNHPPRPPYKHHHHKPFRPGAAQSGGSSSNPSSNSPPSFTPEMRDRQSRGKDPYGSGDMSDGEGGDHDGRNVLPKFRLGRIDNTEDFDKVERRRKAIAFLESPELLMMYAQSTGDSVPAARLHFMKMMCGYDEDRDDVGRVAANSRRETRPAPARDTDKRRGGDRAAGR